MAATYTARGVRPAEDGQAEAGFVKPVWSCGRAPLDPLVAMLMHVRCFAKHNGLTEEEAYRFITISIKLGDRGFWLVDPRDVWSKTLKGARECERVEEEMRSHPRGVSYGTSEG